MDSKVDFLEQRVNKGLVVFVRVRDGLPGHEALDFIRELVNEVLRGEVTDLVPMHVLPPRTFLGNEDNVDLIVHSRLKLLEAPLALQHIVGQDENQVLAPRDNLGQVIQLGPELVVQKGL